MCHDRTYNLKEVARELDVHYMTVYRYVRSGRLPATREGNVWMVDGGDLAAFMDVPDHDHDHESANRRPAVDWVERLAERLVDGDEAGTWAVVEAALTAGNEADVVLGFVADAVRRSGEDPDRTAAPYLAVATAERTVAVLASRFRRSGRRRGTVVLGAPGDESHGFALSVLAVALRLRNIEVLELGTGVPPGAFVDAAERADRLLAVGLGVTTVERLEGATATVAAIRAALDDVTVVIGGRAVRNADIASLTGADAWAPDRTSLVDILDGLAPRRRKPSPVDEPAGAPVERASSR